MQLIDNVSSLHKMGSVIVAVAGFWLTIAEQVLPVIKDSLPPAWQAGLFIAVVAARAIKQPKLNP